MTTTLTQKAILTVSGLIATGIGFAILFEPAGFYSSYGIELGNDPSLMSEIRAPGGALLVMGMFMLSSFVRPGLAGASLWLGAGVYLSYGLSRCLAIALDGWPDSGLVLAVGLEILIGALCLIALRSRRSVRETTELPVVPQHRMPM